MCHPAGYVPAVPVGYGPRAFFSREGSVRVSAFIDGFNLYHAIDDLQANHLKWVNLRLLCEQFAPAPQYSLKEVWYFSAFATWLPAPYKRHREFVAAIGQAGVRAVMGKFKEKDRECRQCRKTIKYHEEKETDVNIAVHLLRGAYRDDFDRALLVSADSDLAPALRIFRQEFPRKQLALIAPVGRGYSLDLVNAVGGHSHCKQMARIHLERSLLPEHILDAKVNIVATRPPKYAPPSGLRPGRFP